MRRDRRRHRPVRATHRSPLSQGAARREPAVSPTAGWPPADEVCLRAFRVTADLRIMGKTCVVTAPMSPIRAVLAVAALLGAVITVGGCQAKKEAADTRLQALYS